MPSEGETIAQSNLLECALRAFCLDVSVPHVLGSENPRSGIFHVGAMVGRARFVVDCFGYGRGGVAPKQYRVVCQ